MKKKTQSRRNTVSGRSVLVYLYSAEIIVNFVFHSIVVRIQQLSKYKVSKDNGCLLWEFILVHI